MNRPKIVTAFKRWEFSNKNAPAVLHSKFRNERRKYTKTRGFKGNPYIFWYRSFNMKLVGMSDSLAGFKVAACPSRSQLNGVLMRPRRFASLVTRAATSHKVDKAVSAAPGRHAIRKFENGLKDANLTAGQKPIASSNQGGLRPHQINAGSNQKLRVAVDVDEGELYLVIREALLKLGNEWSLNIHFSCSYLSICSLRPICPQPEQFLSRGVWFGVCSS